MGSTFIDYGKKKTGGGLFGNKESIPVYLQFVPGIVLSVVTSRDSEDSIGTVFSTVWVRKTSRSPLANLFFTFLGFGRVT